ncbi:MAG: DUF1638 domain-containing protein [Actinomycetia bacterium]|nr:DUF1638 domain-containing protein [Actinomycetes bacterium]
MTTPLIIACGALAKDLRAVLASAGLADSTEVRYLPANLHNHPDGIVPAIAEVLDERPERPTFVAYADCGTGGALDRLLADHPDIERLPGAHCYEFFAGTELFARLHDEAPGSFYLTDFLARNFEPLVWGGLGLDEHPQLLATYFARYEKVVLLAQSGDAEVTDAARAAAQRLGLPLEIHGVGRAGMAGGGPGGGAAARAASVTSASPGWASSTAFS